MKKNIYVFLIILIALLLGIFLVYNVFKIQQNNKKTFVDSGYILESSGKNAESKVVERYYFSANQQYKEKYINKVEFQDTNGDKRKVNNQNFIHYTDGSISSLVNGTLIDLNTIEQEPIYYYNINKNNVLQKEDGYYKIMNLDSELTFTNVLWKISENKYLIASDQINLVFDDNTQKNIKGYVEIEYEDDQVVKIYNQELTYRTISSKVVLNMPNGVKLDLSNKVVSKENKNVLSFHNMVIDSNDNVTIVDLDKMNEEIQKANEDQESKDNNTNQNSNTVLGNNSSQGNIISDDSNGDTAEKINQPIYQIKDFIATSTGIKLSIGIEDKDSLLSKETYLKIMRKDNLKTVYEHVESLGIYNFDLEVSTLEPNTEYILDVESEYTVDNSKYNKNFIYKTFTTSTLGIDIIKDLFTADSLKFNVEVDKDSKVKQAEFVLVNDKDEVLQTKLFKVSDTDQKEDSLEFLGLNSNTSYKIKITNILCEDQIIANIDSLTKTFVTLKAKPEISGANFEIDKRNSLFYLNLDNHKDIDNGIKEYIYEIYDTRTENNLDTPIQTISTTTPEKVNLAIDDIKIFRNVGYVFKVVVLFDDNEKTCEYESEYSPVMKMDGIQFPTLRFEESNVTFESIKGNIIIEDSGNAIDLNQDTVFNIIYTDSVGITKSFTSQGSLTIPIDINNLRANETYKFSVYGKIDLKDGNNPIEQCYIGGIIVKTGLPKNMVASFESLTSTVKDTFAVNFMLKNEVAGQGTLEPQTLTAMEFSIYPGQVVDGSLPTSSPIKSIKLVDNNTKPYESDLKTAVYDNNVTINPEFFGLKNQDFRNEYYTITVTGAYDYTDYKNPLPILNNVYTVKTNGVIPDLPLDPNNALDVSVIRNRDAAVVDSNLQPETIVGYNVMSLYDNIDMYARKITYKAYDSITNVMVDSKEYQIAEDGIIPSARFNVLNGTPFNIVDTDGLRRGNMYYFTYEVELDLNRDGSAETKYPYVYNNKEVILRSKNQATPKQAPEFLIYPKISTANTITYKYKNADVDNAIENNNMLEAKIDNITVDRQAINMQEYEKFSELTFNKLYKGNLTVNMTKRLLKYNDIEKEILINEYFEGLSSLGDISYTIELESNKVIILFKDLSGQLDNVAAARVEFLASDGELVVRDFQEINNNMIVINLNDISSLLKKDLTVNVYAYYDSGIEGYETDASKFVAYQKKYVAGEEKYFYMLNSSGNLVETPTLSKNIYSSIRSDTNLALTGVMDNSLKGNITLNYSRNGFMYQGNVILQKQIDEYKLFCSGSNNIRFDLIIPGISLKDANDEWEIQTEISSVTFKADIIKDVVPRIEGDLIYIDIYKTDENGKNPIFIRTESRLISEFASEITIANLDPKTYYYMKFKTNVIQDDNSISEKELYDIDYQVIGKNYYFSTLADVGISNINVSYNPISYNEKYINISYNLEKITGYQKIEYKIYKYNTSTLKYELFDDQITDDLLIKSAMLKKIQINPGSIYKFGEKYKVDIIPIAEITTLTGEKKELELGTKSKEFVLPTLREPNVAIKALRNEVTKSVDFKVTIYDIDKIIQDDKYTITILDENFNDITPEICKKSYDVNLINNNITLTGFDATKRYTFVVYLKLDYDNDKLNLYNYEKKYVLNPINEYGILIGDIQAVKDPNVSNNIDLIFKDSYKLTSINQVRYSIYNINGYVKTGIKDFIPTMVGKDDEVYYSFKIDEPLNNYGKYFIELQFLVNNQVVETDTLEYIYLQ